MPGDTSISKKQYETLAAFRYTLRKFLRFSEEAAQKAGLTPQQHQALLAIKGFPQDDRVTVSQLADQLQLRHHSVVGLVDRLVAEKLVSRAPSDKDRRKVLVHLTRHGENILGKLSFAHSRQLKQMGPQFKQILDRISAVKE